ncbi:transposase [Streptomyces sp. W16]|uniref:IS110 family transposase n=1 Tax=Streptomyces sp. W16 TaxID=3076631 RepID=UPI00295C04EB|nr:transposase [Streptomyces sp. W16]MDV9172330.1 transposase [Streptomyces sp. W16]
MTTQLPCLWVGIDAWVGINASKAHHWWVAVDNTGRPVWSRKVSNDEATILAGLDQVLALTDDARWAVDLNTTPTLTTAATSPCPKAGRGHQSKVQAAPSGGAHESAHDHLDAAPSRLGLLHGN